MEEYAEVFLHPPVGAVVRYDQVLVNSLTRHSDGSLTFKYRARDLGGKVRRITFYGTYRVEYPPDSADNK